MDEDLLKERVRNFWKILNDKLVSSLYQKFNQRHLFGDEAPDLAILEKIREYYYSDIIPHNSGFFALQEYNKRGEQNLQYGLPETFNSIKEAEPYLPLIVKAMLKEKYPYLLIYNYFSHDYSKGTGINFSNYDKAEYMEIIRNPENNQFRKEAIKFIKKNKTLNNYFLCLPETYDLILARNDFDISLLKYGLFLAYLDEFYILQDTEIDSRYIFSFDDVKRWLTMAKGLKKQEIFLAYPFIPELKNQYVSIPRQILFTKAIDQIRYPPVFKSKKFSYNINGSTVLKNIQNKDFEADIDIRITYKKDENLRVSDEDFDQAVNDYADEFDIELTKVPLNKSGYKYQGTDNNGQKYDFYRASFGFIANYHVPAIRVNYNGTYQLYPSAVIALTIGICVDIRYFATEKQNPFDVVKKYYKRGFSFFLNDNEMALNVEQNSKSIRMKPEDHVPFVLRTPEYLEFLKEHEEDVFITEVPDNLKQTFHRHQMYMFHNRLMGGKFDILPGRNLTVPF